MAVKFQDYYEILGVSRSATQDQIQSAYRKLARKYHPDVNKEKGAEDQFKRVGEAYEVLKDPKKREKYDRLGENWKMGDEFTPPPGWESFDFGGGRGAGSQRGFNFDFGGAGRRSTGGGFSDFFDSLFGDSFDGFGGTSGSARPRSRTSARRKGENHEADLTITLLDAYRGGKKSITLRITETGADGVPRTSSKSFEVNIPKGVTDGKRLRLGGQGGKGSSGGSPGDLYLNLHIGANDRFRIKGNDVEMDVSVTPSEAALGAEIEVPLIVGSAQIRIPAGTQTGTRIRVKGKGLGGGKEPQGDLYAIFKIAVPQTLSPRERELYEELSEASSFDPRSR